MKFIVIDIFEKGQILRTFSGLAPSIFFFLQKHLMVAYVHCPYTVFYLPVFRRIEGGGIHPLRGLKKLMFMDITGIFGSGFLIRVLRPDPDSTFFKARSGYNRNKTQLQIPTLKKKTGSGSNH